MTTTRTPAANRFRPIDPRRNGAPPMPNQTDKALAQVRIESSSAIGEATRRDQMTTDKIAQNMEVIGVDGVHVGTVDGVANGRIRLAKRDSGEGQHKGHTHFIDLGLVVDVEGQRIRLSANAAVAVTFEEEQSGKPV